MRIDPPILRSGLSSFYSIGLTSPWPTAAGSRAWSRLDCARFSRVIGPPPSNAPTSGPAASPSAYQCHAANVVNHVPATTKGREGKKESAVSDR